MGKSKHQDQIDILRRPMPYSEAKPALEQAIEGYTVAKHKKGIMGATLQLAMIELDVSHFQVSRSLLDSCEEYYSKYGNAEEKGLALFIRGRLLSLQGQYEDGIKIALRALHHFQQTDIHEYVAKCGVLCGIMCRRLDMYEESLDYMSGAVEASKRTGIKGLTAMCMQNLNEVKMDLLPVPEAINSFNEFIGYLHHVYHNEGSHSEVNALLCLSGLYLLSSDVKKAIEVYEAGSAMKDRIGFNSRKIDYINRHAEILSLQGDEEGMLSETQQVIDATREAGVVLVEAQANVVRFKFYIRNKKTKEAKKHLDKALHLLKEKSPSQILRELGPVQIQYYKAIGDTVNEIKHLEILRNYEKQVQQQLMLSRMKHITAIHELEIKEKENELMKKDLNLKSQELNMSNHYLQQRNELLNDLKESINSLKKENAQRESIFQTLFKKIDVAFNKEENERDIFKQKFDRTHADFISSLSKLYPSLSSAECRICALLHSGFNTKDISTLLSTSQRNIETHRLHIRKKMNLKRNDNLHLVLASVKV